MSDDNEASLAAFEIVMHHIEWYSRHCQFTNEASRLTAVELAILYVKTFSRNSSFRIVLSEHQYTGDENVASLTLKANRPIEAGRSIKRLLMATAELTSAYPEDWGGYIVNSNYLGIQFVKS